MSRYVVTHTHNGGTPYRAVHATLSVVVHRNTCGDDSAKLQATVTPLLTEYISPPPDYPKPTLPTEVQEVCIDFVAAGLELPADAHQWLRTLRSCALTCRAWLPRARFYLFQSVVLTSLGELHRFVAAIPSRLHPGAQHVQGVDSNQRFTSTSVDHPSPRFTHLVPHYLANRLSQVIWLRLCEDGNKTAAFHRSFLMELSQFHSVKHLTLAGYEFAYFTDIHRIVAALKELATVCLAEVRWNERPPQPLVRGTLWKVREVNLRNCTSSSSGVYFWTLPPPNSHPPSFRGSKDEGSHPALSLHDAEIIKETVDLFFLSGSESYTSTLRWECASQSGWWTLSCYLWREGKDAIDLPGQPVRSGVEFEWRWERPLIDPCTPVRMVRLCQMSPHRAFVFSWGVTIRDQNIDWKLLDNLFEELLELKSVDILVDLEEQEGKKVVDKIRSDLEATAAAGRLSIGVRDEPESDSESWWDDECLYELE